ncbi:DUF6455 family protein [Pseudophaeobacter sp.]|uniref:DUF6455 family protein n=1 Tax=Pseudophaeobacter sp. TaxID=1971739 RepID=UPI0032977891
MHPLGDAMQHLQLLARMGKHLGADLVEAFEAGKISPEDWAEMITYCRGCDAPEHCRAWLDSQERAEGEVKVDLPPSYCCNAARLLKLRDGDTS